MAVFVHSENEFFASRGAAILFDLLADAANDDATEIDVEAAEDKLATVFHTNDVGHLLDEDGDLHFHVNNLSLARPDGDKGDKAT